MKKTEERRPDPEELLRQIHRENRGRLTVFLGAAAGVGKTYTMLADAHDRLAEGMQVAIGWVETHGRAETEKMAAGLPRITPEVLEYRGKRMAEMNIDAILEQKPELVLVDELAHTNVPGSRHVRRFQDVEELLNAGIDVYTTLNIQHIESLNDVVAQITGVIVRETVPDSFVEQADYIQLIDIPPEDLIKRLKDGKVYISGQAQQALKSFFRPGNINALRELALRFTADRVDRDMTQYMRQNRIDGPWPAAGRVMVCVSASPFSAQLIRAAHRLAKGLRADFLAVYVDTPSRRFPMGEKEQDRVWRNLQLAEELGGKIVTVAGNDIVEEMITVARNENVTAVVIGKPRHSRWREFWQGSLVDKLIRRSEGINVYVIQSKAEDEAHSAISTARPEAEAIPWLPIAGGLLMTAAVTAISWLGRDQLEQVNIALLYLLPILFSAIRWGRWPSYITALASVLAFDFLFTPPLRTFSVSDLHYLWSFIIFLVISFVIGGRTEMLKKEVRLTRQRETSVRTLYDFSRQIAAIIDVTQIAWTFVRHTGVAIGRNTVLLLPDIQGNLRVEARYNAGKPDGTGDHQSELPAAEYAVANWVWANSQVAGRSTETLPGADFLFVPLTVDRRTVGVFGIELKQRKMTQEERQLIYAWAGLAAVAVERGNLTEAARQAALLKESDQLRTALFNSVSHELRTPLAAISAAVATLLDMGAQYSAEIRRELLETVKDSADRMERVVANLLDTARIESGMLQLKIDWCDVEDIVGTAIRRMRETTKKHVLRTRVVRELPLLRADCVLLEHVLVNLLDNAIKYSPPGTEITIAAKQNGTEMIVSVEDSGCGIPLQDLTKIFEKFYRTPQQAVQAAGTGLGLSICKSIVEAHQGRIWAKNNPGGGAIVAFAVPVPESDGRAVLKEGE